MGGRGVDDEGGDVQGVGVFEADLVHTVEFATEEEINFLRSLLEAILASRAILGLSTSTR